MRTVRGPRREGDLGCALAERTGKRGGLKS